MTRPLHRTHRVRRAVMLSSPRGLAQAPAHARCRWRAWRNRSRSSATAGASITSTRRTRRDLFFAQGYAAAKDRLFQFEIWRRQATGTAAEILGRRELKRDIGSRLHMFRGDLDAELNHYHPRGKAIIEAFVRGVNAYIAETERTPALLPIEFKALGITPGRWTPAVVISRHRALTSNVTDEVSSCAGDEGGTVETAARAVVFPGWRADLHARSRDRPQGIPRERPRALLRVPRRRSHLQQRRRGRGVPRQRASASRPGASSITQSIVTRESIRATSDPTTGWSPDRGRRARSRSSPTIRIAPLPRRRCATGCTWWRRAGT